MHHFFPSSLFMDLSYHRIFLKIENLIIQIWGDLDGISRFFGITLIDLTAELVKGYL